MGDKMTAHIQVLDDMLTNEISALDEIRSKLDWEIAAWLNAHPIFNDPRMNVPFYRDFSYDVEGIKDMWARSPDPSDVAMTSTWMYVKGKYITHTYATPIVDGKSTKHYNSFPSLHDWFRTLPFDRIDMVIMNFCHAGQASVCHSDFADLSDTSVVSKYHDVNNYTKNDYLLWHSDPRRKFYVMDRDGNKVYKPPCRVCTFTQVLDHGVDPVDFFTWSIKVGGRYTDEFRDTYDKRYPISSRTA